MLKKIDRLAGVFMNEGIKKGDRVIVLLRNSMEAVIAFYSILKIGAIEVALNPIADSIKHIMYILKDCKPKAFVTHTDNLKVLEPALSEINMKNKKIFYAGRKNNLTDFKQRCFSMDDIFKNNSLKKSEKIVSVKKDDIGIIAYTSGTTGLPKGVMLTHDNLLWATKSAGIDFDKTGYNIENDKCLLLIPLCHAFGKQILNSRFLNGATVVLMSSVSFPIELIKLLINVKPSGIVAVPAIYNMLLNTLEKSKIEYEFDFVKYVHSGGAKIVGKLIYKLRKTFTNAMILNGYGLTEAGPRISIMLFPAKRRIDKKKLDSCGRPAKGHTIAIVDDSGNKLKKGCVGEVIFKGPSVMKGYWGKPNLTKKVLKNKWLFTGDVGSIDREGYLYLLDRKKDIIKSGAELISPKEIEMVIDEYPGVKESAVIGVKDDILGERVKAFIVLEPGIKTTKDEIIDFCSAKLPFIKVPRSIEFISSLPKSTLDKVKKAVLRKEISS